MRYRKTNNQADFERIDLTTTATAFALAGDETTNGPALTYAYSLQSAELVVTNGAGTNKYDFDLSSAPKQLKMSYVCYASGNNMCN